jgi:hypothetical protein
MLYFFPESFRIFRKNGRKIQNGVGNLCFRVFALKGLSNLNLISKYFSAFEAYFWYLTFVGEIKMANWFKMASFLRKNLLFIARGWPLQIKLFFQSVKASL